MFPLRTPSFKVWVKRLLKKLYQFVCCLCALVALCVAVPLVLGAQMAEMAYQAFDTAGHFDWDEAPRYRLIQYDGPSVPMFWSAWAPITDARNHATTGDSADFASGSYNSQVALDPADVELRQRDASARHTRPGRDAV